MTVGLHFVGSLAEGHVEVHVYLNGISLSIVGPLWLSLDQWMELRQRTQDDDFISCLTHAEYEETLTEIVATQ